MATPRQHELLTRIFGLVAELRDTGYDTSVLATELTVRGFGIDKRSATKRRNTASESCALVLPSAALSKVLLCSYVKSSDTDDLWTRIRTSKEEMGE